MTQDRPVIEQIELAGFKSIRKMSLRLSRLNVLIGANGAGKSNLISYFSMLRATVHGLLDEFVDVHGGPDSLFHLGLKNTERIDAKFHIKTHHDIVAIDWQHRFRAPDRLSQYLTATGHDAARELVFKSLEENLGIYHLIETSPSSPPRSPCYVQDNQHLRSDAGNLAAMLHLYRLKYPHNYERIVSTIRKLTPVFDDFVLEPQRLNPNNILLNWKQKGSDYLFGPHQISDGTLRVMALVTLLLQPESDFPALLIIDEPELGLHPHALSIVAGLIQAVSTQTQVIVATQSVALLDHFDPEDVIVVDLVDGASEFRRLDEASLKDWLQDYSLGELWEKNVIGGGPMS